MPPTKRIVAFFVLAIIVFWCGYNFPHPHTIFAVDRRQHDSGPVAAFQKLNTAKVVAYPSSANQNKPEVTPNSNFLLKSELKGTSVMKMTETAWSRDDGSCEGDTTFVKTVWHSPAGDTPIYVHPMKEDAWVSGAVIRGGAWEGGSINKFYNFFKQHPSLQFIDIGANIGVYGLTIAKLGCKVVFVEPLLSNVQKLCRSVRDAQFKDAYIVHNALSSRRFTVGFGKYKGNVGGTYVRNATSSTEETAYAVLLDDFLDVFNFTTVAIKLDVETHEGLVLEGADRFFTRVDVRYLMMEWHGDKQATGTSIIKFLTRQNMVPHHPNTEAILDSNDYKKWPGDILWKKKL